MLPLPSTRRSAAFSTRLKRSHGYPPPHLNERRSNPPHFALLGLNTPHRPQPLEALLGLPSPGVLARCPHQVCSHWSARLTWKAFFCVVIAAFTFNSIISLDEAHIPIDPSPFPRTHVCDLRSSASSLRDSSSFPFRQPFAPILHKRLIPQPLLARRPACLGPSTHRLGVAHGQVIEHRVWGRATGLRWGARVVQIGRG